MDDHAQEEASVGRHFHDKMMSISTSTPISKKQKTSSLVNNDSGYVDSFLSDHEHSGHETPVSRQHPSDLNLCSPISLCTIDCNAAGSKPPQKTSRLFDIHEDEVCNGFKEMSMYSFDLGSECSKCDSSVSPSGLGRSDEKFRERLNNVSPGVPCRFDKFLKHFSPKEPDRLIGRKIGLKHVDIVAELHSRSIRSSLILSFLEPADLCRMCQVSRQWQRVCRSSQSVNRRRLDFLKRKNDVITGKENHGKKFTDEQHRGLTYPSVKLGCVQSVELRPKPSPHVQLTQESAFTQAALLLMNDERLCRCPKCNFASKVMPVEERGTCFRCSYDFCVNCFTEYHQARPCVPIACKKAKTDNVGGKKSKRNLKRL